MVRSLNQGAAAAGTIGLGDLTVNRLGFGAMRLCGDYAWGRPRDRGDADRVLRRAVELGVNFIDTADSYGPETNETMISQALYPYPPGLVIATKGGLVRPRRGAWVPDGRPDHLRRALEVACCACGWSVSISIRSMRLTRMCRLPSQSEFWPICSAREKFATSAFRTSRSRSSRRRARSHQLHRFRTRIICEIEPAKTFSLRASALELPFCPGFRWVESAA